MARLGLVGRLLVFPKVEFQRVNNDPIPLAARQSGLALDLPLEVSGQPHTRRNRLLHVIGSEVCCIVLQEKSSFRRLFGPRQTSESDRL